jgi:hypothetical protein
MYVCDVVFLFERENERLYRYYRVDKRAATLYKRRWWISSSTRVSQSLVSRHT